MRNVGSILSAVAVVLAVGALVAALAVPGPAGPQGATGATGANGTNGTNGARGPQGPAGNGTLMVSFRDTAVTSISAACTQEAASTNITVPSAGTVVITASVTVFIQHTSGTSDNVEVYVGTSVPTEGACYWPDGQATVAASAASDNYIITVPVSVATPVSAAGTYYFPVGGSTGGTAWFTWDVGYIVFYPG